MLKREFNKKKLLLVDDLAPEDIAMVQALYARRATSAEDHIQKIYDGRRDAIREELELYRDSSINIGSMTDALMAIGEGAHASAKAGKFMSSFYVGYGHKSIGDCGTTTLFIEGVSTLVAKAIQDWSLYSGQETSTRAIDFAASEDPKKIIGRLVDPAGAPVSRLVLDRWMSFYERSQTRVFDEVVRRHPRRMGEGQDKYEAAVRARVFDVLRGFLPAGVTTQLSWHTNIRQAGDHLIGLTRHPLAEVREVGQALAIMLYERYPSSGASFGDIAALSGVGTKNETPEDKERRWAWETRMAEKFSYPIGGVGAPFYSTIPPLLLQTNKEIFYGRPRGTVLPHFLSDIGQLTFGFELDFGSFRDIQRHRNGVCRMPLLTTKFGFESWYVDQLDQLDEQSRNEAMALIRAQTDTIAEIDIPEVDRQNYIALGFKVPVAVTYGLPAAVYVMELRSGKAIHPTLRKVIHQNMILPFQNEFPEFLLHVDMDPDDWSLRRATHNILEIPGVKS